MDFGAIYRASPKHSVCRDGPDQTKKTRLGGICRTLETTSISGAENTQRIRTACSKISTSTRLSMISDFSDSRTNSYLQRNCSIQKMQPLSSNRR
ncbi:hypothetical protein QR680_010689 [Steinernema hermaphroditum]|uniref:Uncharacterized protein n=1 Tax=Steinernema hermaphroditum TaxID=289476 RepID=A0AA39IR00_9BILA|nr:hypothetical protein QR680_010689 [Steinernema hermaphroditum]